MKTQLSPYEIRWREFRATLPDTRPDEIEFSGERQRKSPLRPIARTRRRRPYPQLAGMTGRQYHREYTRLKRAEERGAA